MSRARQRRRPPAVVMAGAAALLLAVVALAVLLLTGMFSGEKHRPTFYEQMADDAGFDRPWSCELNVRSPDAEIRNRWPSAKKTAALFCTIHDGKVADGYLEYAKFADPRALDRALASRAIRHHRYCVFGSEIVVNGYMPIFSTFCERRHGVLGGRET